MSMGIINSGNFTCLKMYCFWCYLFAVSTQTHAVYGATLRVGISNKAVQKSLLGKFLSRLGLMHQIEGGDGIGQFVPAMSNTKSSEFSKLISLLKSSKGCLVNQPTLEQNKAIFADTILSIAKNSYSEDWAAKKDWIASYSKTSAKIAKELEILGETQITYVPEDIINQWQHGETALFATPAKQSNCGSLNDIFGYNLEEQWQYEIKPNFKKFVAKQLSMQYVNNKIAIVSPDKSTLNIINSSNVIPYPTTRLKVYKLEQNTAKLVSANYYSNTAPNSNIQARLGHDFTPGIYLLVAQKSPKPICEEDHYGRYIAGFAQNPQNPPLQGKSIFTRGKKTRALLQKPIFLAADAAKDDGAATDDASGITDAIVENIKGNTADYFTGDLPKKIIDTAVNVSIGIIASGALYVAKRVFWTTTADVAQIPTSPTMQEIQSAIEQGVRDGVEQALNRTPPRADATIPEPQQPTSPPQNSTGQLDTQAVENPPNNENINNQSPANNPLDDVMNYEEPDDRGRSNCIYIERQDSDNRLQDGYSSTEDYDNVALDKDMDEITASPQRERSKLENYSDQLLSEVENNPLISSGSNYMKYYLGRIDKNTKSKK